MENPHRHEDPADPIQRSEQAAGQPTEQDVTEAISDSLLRIHRQSYGGSAERVISHLIEDTLIVLLDGLELLPNEEFLVQNGDADAVVRLRTQYQKAIESTFRAAVERATGRRVISFASHITVEEPRFALEVFRLEPR